MRLAEYWRVLFNLDVIEIAKAHFRSIRPCGHLKYQEAELPLHAIDRESDVYQICLQASPRREPVIL